MPRQGWREKQPLAITLLLLHTLIIQRMKPAFAFTLWISEIVLVYPGDLPEFQAPLALGYRQLRGILPLFPDRGSGQLDLNTLALDQGATLALRSWWSPGICLQK
jgi:hypothetical protein